MITAPCVVAAHTNFQRKFEGAAAWMYLDVKGLVTTAIGLLIDPVESALHLPWQRRDAAGTPATEADIWAEWAAVKAMTAMAKRGGVAFAAVTNLRLTAADIDAVTTRKLAANEVELLRHFPKFGTFPPDAQLAIHSLAWAAGPAFAAGFPHFTGLANQNDMAGWAACAGKSGDAGADPTRRGQAWLREDGNPGLRPRNLANRACLFNAAAVAGGLAEDGVLHYGTPDSAPAQ